MFVQLYAFNVNLNHRENLVTKVATKPEFLVAKEKMLVNISVHGLQILSMSGVTVTSAS